VTALRALRESGCSAGDDVAIVGTGTIGLLALMMARAMGAPVTAVGVDPAGLDLAAHLGATRTAQSGQEPAASFSVVVEASGAAPGFLEAVRLTENGGTTAAVGVVGGKTDGVPVGEITLRGLTVRGIRHGLDYYDEVLDMFAAGHLNAGPLLAATYPIDQVRDAFETLAGGRSGAPKVVLRP